MKKNANFQLIKTTVLMDYFKHLMGRYIKKKILILFKMKFINLYLLKKPELFDQGVVKLIYHSVFGIESVIDLKSKK